LAPFHTAFSQHAQCLAGVDKLSLFRAGRRATEVRFVVDTDAVSGVAAYAMQHAGKNEALDAMVGRLPGLFDDCFLAALRATPAPRPLLVEIRGSLPFVAWK
jgi:hypothetical protein